eukprot:7270297-Pyramimonas_sp.AAC.1
MVTASPIPRDCPEEGWGEPEGGGGGGAGTPDLESFKPQHSGMLTLPLRGFDSPYRSAETLHK